jgi:hypothetical protein
MWRLGMRRVLILAVLLQGCAPRPIYRQTEIGDSENDGERDGAADGAGPPDAFDDDPDAPPDPDAALTEHVLDGAGALDEGADDGGAPLPPTALLVVGMPPTLAADDAKLKARLESKGFTVTVLDDDAMPPTVPPTLVVVSGSVASATLAAKYVSFGAPLICLEPFVFGDLKMTGSTRNTDFGQTDGTQIAVTLAGHPLAGGHPAGNLTVVAPASSLGWGVAAAGAEKVATLVGMANRATVFAYEAGEMMVGMPAPARRVGLFPASPTPDRLNMVGWQLFDAAVDWATR